MPHNPTSRATTLGMKQAIRNTMSRIAGNPSIQSSLKNAGYIYCAYVSTLMIEAIISIPTVAQVSIRNPRADGGFRWPMAPSKMQNQRSSWYEIRTQDGNCWELHLCCECQGVSGHLHELDIALLNGTVATNCRATRREPMVQQVAFLVECKNVGAIEYGTGREFLGLCWEFPTENPSSRQWQWRGQRRLGALVGTLAGVPSIPSAFELVDARQLIARPFVEPRRHSEVNRFQQEVVMALTPILV